MKKINVFQTAFISLCFNFAFSIYNAVLGVINHSFWFLALAAYFVVLGVMRFAVVLTEKRSAKYDISQNFIMRFTGVLLIFMGITLAGITYISVSEEMSTRYGEIVMITMALYAFTKITVAIINIIKVKHTNRCTVKVLRNISLADAAVSIFSLQRSMLVSFGGMSADDIFLMNGLTGTAVYILIFLLGINLIGGKRVTMAKSKFVKANQKIADTVVDGYKKVEDTVVGGYKKVEDAVVSGYTKIEDKFVDQYLTHDGETVEEAKERLKTEKNKD